MNSHRGAIIAILYFIILLLLASVHLPSFDTFYYWEWSRHLALSYYDGSPMIAYFIKLSTLLFGDTLFALNSVGIVCAALTSWILYRTARLFLSKEASYIAMLLWLFSPLVALFVLQQTTYDAPLVLFWALTLYYVVKLIQFNQRKDLASADTSEPLLLKSGVVPLVPLLNSRCSVTPSETMTKDLYLAGISIGLMLLSKYSGIVLVIALLVFMMTSSHKYLLKTRHFYVMLLIPFILFSPVLIWNQQHEWQSFLYQLGTHQLKNAANPLVNIIRSFFCVFIPSLNVMFLPPVLCWFKQIPAKNKDIVRLCGLICSLFIVFYLFTASQVTVRAGWLTPYLITSALLGGYCFQTFQYRKSTFLLIGIYAVASVGIYLNSSFPLFLPSKKTIYYQLMQNLNATYPQLPKTIVTTGWLEARMLFFLKNKPPVYTVACGAPENQYALWSTDVVRQIKNKTINEVLYIDTTNRIHCVETFFDHCDRLSLPAYTYNAHQLEIYAFTCTNDKKQEALVL